MDAGKALLAVAGVEVVLRFVLLEHSESRIVRQAICFWNHGTAQRRRRTSLGLIGENHHPAVPVRLSGAAVENVLDAVLDLSTFRLRIFAGFIRAVQETMLRFAGQNAWIPQNV